MAQYSIKDLERLSGIKAHTIRIWEKRYGLIEPKRTDTNIRMYCDEELKKLLNISTLNRHGIKISKIAQLTSNEVSEEVNKILEKPDDNGGKIESLTVAMIELDEDKFEKVLAKTIIQLGFENTVMEVLYPFFNRVGTMWQTGAINVAQEHFISNLIRLKMFAAIDNQIVSKTESTKQFLLFLPEGELHELGLLFYTYILKKRGHIVTYLGQSLPVNDLISVASAKKYDFFVTAFVASCDELKAVDYINVFSKEINVKSIVVTGSYTETMDSLPKDVKKMISPSTFINWVEAL